jgi:hypothetical protein
MTRVGRNRNVCFGVSNGNKQPFVLRNFRRQVATQPVPGFYRSLLSLEGLPPHNRNSIANLIDTDRLSLGCIAEDAAGAEATFRVRGAVRDQLRLLL